MPNLMAISVTLNILKNSLLLILFFVATTGRASDTMLCNINTVSSYFTVDGLRNIYYINASDEIVKYNCKDSTTITYSNLNLGKPTFIDVSNPLKILVFYPDRQLIVILDNQLSELLILRLNGRSNTPNYQPGVICKLTGTDHIWMYDELSRKLIRLDESGKVIAASEIFDQLFDFSVEVTKIFSTNDKIYLYAEDEGLLVFDAYANYVNTIPFVQSVQQVTDKYVIALSGSSIMWYDLRTGEILSTNLGVDGIHQLYIDEGIFFLRSDNRIYSAD